MLDITSVFAFIVDCLGEVFVFLRTHGIILGEYQVSFFSLAIIMLIASVIISALVPWGGDDDE